MRKRLARSLPVLMYHYINDYPNSIAVSKSAFEEHCRVLAENGWQGIGLDQARAYLLKGEPLPEKSVLFTFDDGYLDNYVNALPILARYGHQGIVCVVTERIEQGAVPRRELPLLLSGKAEPMSELDAPIHKDELGFDRREDIFCNEAELKVMELDGTLRIIPHSAGHRGVFIGPEYQSVMKPGNQRRTFYKTHVPQVWGLPNFKIYSGLKYKAFIPSEALITAVTAVVPQDFSEAHEFFSIPHNEENLKVLLENFKDDLGHFESDLQRTERMHFEIAEAKKRLETMLGKPMKTFCWPWGMYCAESLAIAQKNGFDLFFTTEEGVNPPAQPLAVHRFKAKMKSGEWLLNRVRVYSRPILGRIYAKIRL